MKKLYFIAFALFFASLYNLNNANAQGCVAVRSACGANVNGSAFLQKGDWQVGANYRYFRSFRHFRGHHEEPQRVANGTEVVNNANFMDFLVSYGLSERLSANFTLPFVYHDRSSMYEHGGNPPNGLGQRHFTSSQGLADIRMGVSYWLLAPEKNTKRNLAIGVGVKLPTGDYRAMDYFHNQGPARNQKILGGVDQSIQPGDGGFGQSIDLQGYLSISNNIMVNANLFYLINAREKYTLPNRSGGTQEFSVPDQYAARLGFIAMLPAVHGLSIYAGGRLEGIPSSDLFGKDSGFRRPGYALSVEPGISYSLRNTSFNLTVPVAVKRVRTQNFNDKIRSAETGTKVIGDAAFADYLINLAVAFRINKQRTPEIPVFDQSQH